MAPLMMTSPPHTGTIHLMIALNSLFQITKRASQQLYNLLCNIYGNLLTNWYASKTFKNKLQCSYVKGYKDGLHDGYHRGTQDGYAKGESELANKCYKSIEKVNEIIRTFGNLKP